MRCIPALAMTATALIVISACEGGSGGENDATQIVVPAPPISVPIEVEEEPRDDLPPVVATPPTVLPRVNLNMRFPADRSQDELASVWLAVIDVFQVAPRPLASGDVFVDLLRYNSPLTFLSHANFYEQRNETCEVRDISDSGDGGDPDEDPNRAPSVSGGDILTLSSAGGDWLNVPFSNTDRVYESAPGVFPGSFPGDVTLSVPGAEFPAIDALPLGLPVAPVRLSPTFDEIVTPDTQYRWVPGVGNRIRVEYLSFVDGQFQGFPIICYVGDDGEFGPSQGALEEIARRPGELTVRYVRESRWLDYRDGVVLYQNVSIADI